MRIIYLMHIDWRWIKQRPQFLAESLTKQHDVVVAYRINPSRKRLSSNESHVRRLPLLPIPRRLGPWSEKLDAFLQKIWLNIVLLRFRPQVVWVTFPTLYSYLPARLRDLPIVYDCMDDAAAFFNDDAARKRIISSESRLVRAATRVLCSSQTLCDRLIKQYGVADKVTLVRNSLSNELLEVAQEPSKNLDNRQTTNAAYIGTISEWFDFPSILSLLERLENLRVHLIGPSACRVPKHERLIYHGVVDRTRLREYVQPFDAFLMPFIINPLIEGVDPVKLYEYMAFGKETIAVYYKEIERFAPYVNLYSSSEEFYDLMRRLCAGTLERKAAPGEALAFLKENTWESRGEQVNDLLSALAQPVSG
ncbi:MAG: glycosyltransferase [Armatimonadota bacterium]